MEMGEEYDGSYGINNLTMKENVLLVAPEG